MRRILLLPTAVLASALVLGCGPEGSTLAGPEPGLDQKGHAAGGHPEITRFREEFHFVIPEGELCPSFEVQADIQNKIIVQVFETHLVVHFNSKATLTNLDTGFSIDDDGAWTQIVHFDGQGNAETVSVIGGIFRIVIPGQGIVAQDTGIITFDPATGEVLFEGGPHEVFHGGIDYCALLSGGGA
jgi:hypothetical protein